MLDKVGASAHHGGMTIGRALKWKMLDDAAETPERVAERIRYRVIAAQAVQETTERFGPMTPENAREAIAWQSARIRELQERGRG